MSGNPELSPCAAFDGRNVEAGAISIVERETAADVVEPNAIRLFGVGLDGAAAGIVNLDNK